MLYLLLFLISIFLILTGNFSWLLIAVVVGVVWGTLPYYLKLNEKRNTSSSVKSDSKFQNAKRIDGWLNHFILISEKGDMYLHPSKRYFSIKEVNSYKINIDGSSQGGLGKAAVGGLLFGGAGAIVGGLTANKSKIKRISVVFSINDFSNPTAELLILDYLTSEGSSVHRGAQESTNTLFATLEFVEANYKQTLIDN